MLHLFISGLREDIKNSVLSHEPKTFDEALNQAHIQERRIQAEKGPVRPALANKGAPLLPNPNVSSSYQNSSSKIASNNNLNWAAARFPLKRLSHAETQSRRERGLCYYCEEKYTVGHKCKSPPQLLLLTNEPDIEPILPESFVADDFLAEDILCLEVQEHSAISYHALAGGHFSSTLRFLGHVNGSPVQVLVDGGSDHNFIQARIASFLQLPIVSFPSFVVVVGSGQRLRCKGVVQQVPLIIQECKLTFDLYVLSLHGADVVLRASWLSTLGRVVTNYREHIFQFSYQGTTNNWKGLEPPSTKPIQLHSLRRDTTTDAISMYYCLQIVSTVPTQDEQVNPTLQAILESFVDIFQKPQGLPPSRAHDHAMHLVPGTKPVNVRPYRYPYFQKQAMEEMIT